MLLLMGRPLLAHLIERLESAGLAELLIITGYQAEVIKHYFREHPPEKAQLRYRHQTPLDGTASATLLGSPFVGGGPFILSFGNVLVPSETYSSMSRLAENSDAVIAVTEVDDPYQNAAVYVDGDRVTRIVERPPRGSSGTDWASAGVYCLGPSIFDELDRVSPSPRGEYDLADGMSGLIKAGKTVRWHPIGGLWHDVGRPDDLQSAETSIDDLLDLRDDSVGAPEQTSLVLPYTPEVAVLSRRVDELIDKIYSDRRELLHLSHREFESFVADLWSRFGFEVELTKQTRDGGRDVIAIRRAEAQIRFLIECKRWSPNQRVGVQVVRQLFAVKADERATKAILATTSYFTKDAKELFARQALLGF